MVSSFHLEQQHMIDGYFGNVQDVLQPSQILNQQVTRLSTRGLLRTDHKIKTSNKING